MVLFSSCLRRFCGNLTLSNTGFLTSTSAQIIQLRTTNNAATHHFNAGNSVFREIISVSKGEGRSIFEDNPQGLEEGLDYTGRLEYLPFGLFQDKGDYSEADLAREPKPKLALGLTYDLNENATRSRGHLGQVLDKNADLRSWIIDMMFKYQGISVLTEFVDRKIFHADDLVS